ncbi:periplasmic beta-glucosidase/beta-xylosidase [Treponema primitia ZAS-2]|uniref:beta-glucosidase n=1 Tax=Treponema primitia (strain ATCC BAA-887 / DSM 12427 / ZAS-2) TaxID=545694 RepID=F5YQV7_TREPZ|nr:glycoside hydrolase family 3 N-terminal domain-containing protein [Treponema primitia]AEF85136.1 periplasmic beta-glucosidase/beta-xylosidase [Treponema primitia ZAS-2]
MEKKWEMIQKDGYVLIVNKGGATLGIQTDNKDRILEQDGFAFKDLNGNGKLDPYEDWRLPFSERIKDLVKRLSIEEIAGLMLYSSHQAIARNSLLSEMMYPGQNAQDTRQHVYDLTEGQKKFLKDDKLRHVLMAMADDAVTAAKWSNQAQAFVESLGLGIPVNISSDPRHTPSVTAEFNMGAGGDISIWPDHIGLAATFDPNVVKQFGLIASKEYRAMGITTALSPQIDLSSDPRWNRFTGTFGEVTDLAVDMARAYCDGFQTSEGVQEIEGGWGFDSVNAMAKHWPGGGSGEGGRDAHYGFGKYAVYPGNNLEEQLKPFINGAFKLDGKTSSASAVMPYYTISYGIDTRYGENVGNSYNKYIITDLLRQKYGFDGVICTDWLITSDFGDLDKVLGGKCWGVETLSIAERHYKILMAGVDQFGGNNDIKPVLDAYEMGVKEKGEHYMRERFELSAARLLRNIFRTGLFENPYLDTEESRKIAGRADFVRLGYEAQVKSVVLLKNKGNVLPLAKKTKVYIPIRHLGKSTDWFGRSIEARDVSPISRTLLENFFEVTDNPENADGAICFIGSPKSLPYSKEKGYLPISLQYRPYTAKSARKESIAGEDRSYYNKTTTTENESDLDMILDTRKLMPGKPVIVVANAKNPFIVSEFETACDALILHFGVRAQVLLDILSGTAEPSALLPFQMPLDMETVEAQFEDVPRDMKPYKDECGNTYDFAFGSNWHGVISDWRTVKYGPK